jgi:hypothetical protein
MRAVPAGARPSLCRRVGAHAYLVFVVAGGALVGLWIVARLPKAGPTTTRGAALCFLFAWLLPGLAVPLLNAALPHLPAGPAVLVTVFPVLVATFAAIGLALRYVVGLLSGHTAR